MADESARLARLRDRLLAGLQARIDGVSVNGSIEHRLPHNLHVNFDGVDGSELLIGIGDIAVSTGSACSSGTLEPSHVLKAMGLPLHDTQNAIRFSLGSSTTDAEIDRVLEVLPGLVERLRQVTAGRAVRPAAAAST